MKKSFRYYILSFLIGCFVVYVTFMLKKDNWQHHNNQAVLALEETRYQDVINACNEAIKLDSKRPNIYAVYAKKAKALNKIHAYNSAIEAADKAIEINPKCEEAYLAKVDALFMLNKDDELASVLEELIILNPHSPLKGLLNAIRKEKGKWCY